MKLRGKTITIFILGLAILFGIITRFYKLGEAPAGLYLDEAAQGYSAYSILKTGKDEFGKAFPIVFRSFTDFKTPVYIYLLVPLIPIFGLTKFAVRFPSFFFSVLTIPFLYLLLKEITPKKLGKPLALVTTLLLSISPWHVLFGRTNFETNVALFFFLVGAYFFYLGLRYPSRLIISAVAFAISIPAYHALRLVTPAILLVLFIKHRKKLLSSSYKKILFVGAVAGFFIILPTLSVATTPGFLARAAGLNIFTHHRQMPAGFIENCRGLFCGLINSPLFLTTREFFSLYFSYFSPRHMFVLGDFGPRSSFPELSTFFLWQFPFYLYGLYRLLRNKELGELRFFTISFLLIAPLPAAVTRDPYSTIRALQMVVPQLIIISLGIIHAFKLMKGPFYLKKSEDPRQQLRSFGRGMKPIQLASPKASTKRDKGPRAMPVGIYKLTAYGFFSLVVIYSLAKLWSAAIILNEHFRASYWNYGWEQVVEVLKNGDPNLPVVIDNARTEPYSQLLFFLKYDPATYQQENFEVSPSEYYTNMDRNKTKKIGNIVTRPIDWEQDLLVEQYLVGDKLAISEQQIKTHNLTLIDEVSYPDGVVAFRITKTNPK